MVKKLAHLINAPLFNTDGSLCQIQSDNQIPFTIERIFFIYGVSEGAVRGAHTHHMTAQALFCIQGSIDIRLDDGKTKETVHLDRPNVGVLLEPHIWHEMADFKKDTIILVLASKRYDPEDYVRSYEDFLNQYSNEKH